jgi:hypothetical protein
MVDWVDLSPPFLLVPLLVAVADIGEEARIFPRPSRADLVVGVVEVEVEILRGEIGITIVGWIAGVIGIDVFHPQDVIRLHIEEGVEGIGIGVVHGEGGDPFRDRGQGRHLGGRDMTKNIFLSHNLLMRSC